MIFSARLPAAVGEISPCSFPEGTCGWGHLNNFSVGGQGDLNKNFPKIQIPGGLPGGMLKLRFDLYINLKNSLKFSLMYKRFLLVFF